MPCHLTEAFPVEWLQRFYRCPIVLLWHSLYSVYINSKPCLPTLSTFPLDLSIFAVAFSSQHFLNLALIHSSQSHTHSLLHITCVAHLLGTVFYPFSHCTTLTPSYYTYIRSPVYLCPHNSFHTISSHYMLQLYT